MTPGQRPNATVRSSLWAARHRTARCNLPGTDPPIAWEGTYEDEQYPAIRGWLRPYLVLLPAGVTWTIDITTDAGGLLHHLFTLASCRGRIATCFCGPHPAGWLLAEASPPRVLSDAVLYGVRTFLGPDNAEPRSPNRPEAACIIHARKRAVNGRRGDSNRILSRGGVTPPLLSNF